MFSEKRMAVRTSWTTLVGVLKRDYPLPGGNCFGVVDETDRGFKIVNFVHENLEEVLRRGIEWPIEIKVISPHVAVIHDSRIPDEWYRDHWCEVCCPRDLLPQPQQHARERAVARGQLTEHGDSCSWDPSKRAILPGDPPKEVIKFAVFEELGTTLAAPGAVECIGEEK